MEDELQPEPGDWESEQGVSPELGERPVETLPQVLGFVETEELRHLRAEWMEALAAAGETADLASRYQALAEEVVEQHQDVDFARAQIGLIIQVALIRRANGDSALYKSELGVARDYAEGMGLWDVVSTLETAIMAVQQSDE